MALWLSNHLRRDESEALRFAPPGIRKTMARIVHADGLQGLIALLLRFECKSVMFALFCFLVAAEAAVATQREDKNRPVTKVAGVAGSFQATE